MSAIALVGSVTLLFKQTVFKRLLFPLVAFAAGSLIGGALFHMIPAVLATGLQTPIETFIWIALGFLVFSETLAS